MPLADVLHERHRFGLLDNPHSETSYRPEVASVLGLTADPIPDQFQEARKGRAAFREYVLALDAIWRSVSTSQVDLRQLVLVDEAWRLLTAGLGARFLLNLAKGARKYGAGLTVVNLSPAVAEELAYSGQTSGVIINDVKPNSAAASVGLQRGDVIVDLNGTKIDSTKRLADLTKQQASTWTMTIKRGDQTIRRQFRG